MEDRFGMITLLLIALGIGAEFFWSTVQCAEDRRPGCSLTCSAGGLRAGSMSLRQPQPAVILRVAQASAKAPLFTSNSLKVCAWIAA